MRSLVSRLAAGLAERTDTLPASTVHSFENMGNGLAMVVVSHSHNAGPKANREALAKVIGDRARIIENSFRPISKPHESRLVSVGFVVANEIVQELDTTVQSRMKTVAKNVLMDSVDQSLWDVTESGGQKFIRRQGAEDIAEVLSAIKQTRADVVTASTLGAADTQGQDYVAYVDTTTATVKHGFVVANDGQTSKILPRAGTDLVEVANVLIVDVRPQVDTKDNYLSRNLQKVEAKLNDPEKLKAYYRQVYNYDPAFLNLLEAAIDKSASL